MKVGFDAKKAMRNHTGIGNYSRRCIDAVRAAGAATQLFYPQKAVLGELWRNVLQWWDVRRSHIDIYHGLSNELPFGIGWSGVKTVVTIHDLIFLRMPETYGWTQRQILKLKTRYACRKADRIVAVSEMTRRDLIRYYNISPSRIEVVCQSVSDIYRAPLPAARLRQVARQYSLPACYILCVGTIQQRKNQHTLVKALPLLPPHTHLVLVGREEAAYARQVRHTAEKLKVASRLHICHGVPSEDLPAFYRLATLFACLSRFEGFGIPIAEALTSGTPVIAATGSCLEEAGGPHSIYLTPDDVEGLADSIRALLSDNRRRQDMAAAGQRYAERFTDQALGHHLLDIYRQLLDT